MTDAPVVLLVTTNGAGMGHLARQTAVAQSAQGFRPFLVSMSVGIATVLPATGMPGEYIPGYHRGWVPRGQIRIPSATWHPTSVVARNVFTGHSSRRKNRRQPDRHRHEKWLKAFC